MRYLADRRSAKELDIKAQEMGISGIVLMERASLKTADVIEEIINKKGLEKKVISVCGTGNNGGDGAACARILFEKGYKAEIIIAGDRNRLSEQMTAQLEIAENSGLRVCFASIEEVESGLKSFENGVIVDALFGVGLSKEITGKYKEVIEIINSCAAYKVAVDLPSGVDGDNGKILGTAVRADVTVTFGVSKIGLSIYPGKEYAGEVYIEDIGFPKKVFKEVKFPAFTYDSEEFVKLLPERKEYSNKGDYGKVLIIAGSEGMSGAAYLSALAAYKSGAGLVKIITVSENSVSLQTLLPEAIMFTYSDKPEDEISIKTEDELKKNITSWGDVIVAGPGIGKSKRSLSIMKLILKESGVPVIIDADGIALFRECMEIKENEKDCLINALNKNIILTPHVKELANLLGRKISEVKSDIMEIAEEFKEIKGVLVIKEAKTVVTGSGKCYINSTGNSAMAKGGSGDALTGMIAAFSACGKDLFDAATLGVFAHGLSGDRAKEEFGGYSVLARDIAGLNFR